MSDQAEIRFLEPLDQTRVQKRKVRWWQKPVLLAALVMVALPTFAATVYYMGIASDRYVSETRFVVRRAGQTGPNALGLSLASVGLSPTSTDAFIVHEFTRSRAGIDFLKQRHDLSKIFISPKADPLSRAVRPWQEGTGEDLYKGIQRFITVGYDSTTGISTLRVEAFTPEEAQAVTQSLLLGGEKVVNDINIRSSQAAIQEGERTVREATERLTAAQNAVTNFRNREQIVDPEHMAKASAELLGGLMSQLAGLEAERRQIARETPQSPLLAPLDRRIESFRQQIDQERTKIAGNTNSLAPKIASYEELVFERDAAARTLTAANQALETARIEARRQLLFLDRVVEPNLPDASTQPRRLLSILTVFITSLLIFACSFLLWAGIREHRHE
ncbi:MULTISPECIES: chain-length determining protein [unclassified Brevundimonas]|uniref:chain-length determining protein n=1 Tax=unclassified Brevundimonas TaxID=2622653 RepID=UPI0025C3FE82|nr:MULTISPECIES: chain-length determining protein [unclassified Brevundimonas]